MAINSKHSGKATERVRGRAWQRIRRAVLEAEPLCRICLASGRIEAATEIDHITSLHRGGSATDIANLQPLCQPCHEAKTRRDLGQREKLPIGLDGWPVGNRLNR